MVETVAGSANAQFVYSRLGTQYAVVQNGTLAKGMVPLPGGDTAVYNSSGLNYIRRTDLLGSSRLATTWAHGIYSKDAYAPFGEPYDETATTDRSFTGQHSDLTQNQGIYDSEFRKLDTTAGRWLSPDPSGWSAVDLTNPQSLNRHAYVLNNPTLSTDSLGLEDDCTSIVGTPTYSTECANLSNTYYSPQPYWDASDVMADLFEQYQMINGHNSTAAGQQYGYTMPEYGSADYDDGTDDYGLGETFIARPRGHRAAPMSPYYFTCLSGCYMSAPAPVDIAQGGQSGSGGSGAPSKTAFSGAVSIPVAPGVLVSVPIAVTNNKVCVGLGGGFGSPGFGVDAGIVHTTASNIVDVLEGASVSVGATTGWWGVQWSHNSSGVASGNLIGTPGVSLTVTYSVCF